MTYLNINLKLEELTEAVLNSDMNTLMKSLAITVFNAYMEEERHQFIQAAPHERSDQRQDYRNGYYERQWTLSIGTLKLQVPRTRSGEFKTELFERYQRNEQAFLLSMMECICAFLQILTILSPGKNISQRFTAQRTSCSWRFQQIRLPVQVSALWDRGNILSAQARPYIYGKTVSLRN